MSDKQSLPILPLRDPDLVVFPGLFCEVDVGRVFSINAVTAAKENFNSKIIIASQNDHNVDDPVAKDLYGACAEAEIRRIIPIDNDQNKIRIILVGTRRGILKSAGKTTDEASYLYGVVEFFDDPDFALNSADLLKTNELRNLILANIPAIAVEDGQIVSSKELSLFLDNIAGQLSITGKQKLSLLKERDPLKRLDDIIVLANKVIKKGQETPEQKQQIAADPAEQAMSEDIKRLKKMMDESGMPEDTLKVTKQELRRLTMMSPGSAEFQVTYNYVETLVSLPWNKSTEDIIDIDNAREILDADHYGLEKVKERILEFLAIRKLAPDRKGSILCLCGSPGVGKAQPLDAKVLTPNGFVNMGDIEVGDVVSTPDGKNAKVISLYPQGVKDIFKVEFSNGNKTECCIEHLWKTKSKGEEHIKALGQIFSDLVYDAHFIPAVDGGFRKFKSIEFVGRKEAKCILIDHPDHLYITDDFIVTHNTSVGKSIAKAMGRKFVRMSLGGINDEAEIRGHRRTYIGAIPGKIIHNIRKLEVNNPIYMLDEIDKICSNARGDPASALLEVLDPEQNNAFTDNYLSVPFDLSKVLFIVTANEISPIIPALKDRLEIIEIPGYSPFDKVKIAKQHLIPKQKKENGLEDNNITLSDDAISFIIDQYTGEAGVRTLERSCGTVLRKMAVRVASDKPIPEVISQEEIPDLLGPPSAFIERAAERPEIGLSAGLAWSRHGGSLLFIESVFNEGKGEIKLTGNLGDVLKESATAAYTWIKANAKKFNIDLGEIFKHDIHVHLPAGAVPKDGPSAGIAITASILSLITNRPVRNDVAMTGEITLRGRVLPVGGLKEKILAAHRAGIKQIIFPEQNKHDIDELPEDVKVTMIFTPVLTLDEALEYVLMKIETVDIPGKIGSGSGEALVNMSA